MFAALGEKCNSAVVVWCKSMAHAPFVAQAEAFIQALNEIIKEGSLTLCVLGVLLLYYATLITLQKGKEGTPNLRKIQVRDLSHKKRFRFPYKFQYCIILQTQFKSNIFYCIFICK